MPKCQIFKGRYTGHWYLIVPTPQGYSRELTFDTFDDCWQEMKLRLRLYHAKRNALCLN
jgi:hypothetical protein